ncbi:MAG TPA: FAD:protein FMN transferase [Steroidobacteraceae bacterium]|nr:FAD:protein FMN transferase [Steroidobacteraceae bacterium]
MPSPLLVAERAPAPIGANSECEVRRARPLLGTIVEIRAAAHHAPAQLHAAIDSAFAAVERVQRLMSYHDPASDVSRINRAAALSEQPVDMETYTVIEAALRFSTLSNGAFDPCIGERMEKWGYLPPRVAGSEHSGTIEGTWRDIVLVGPCRVRFARPVRLDLGGIAKGYAVDRAVQALQNAGIEKILVNAGGDLRIAGPWEQRIRLRHPRAPHLSTDLLTLHDAALATSAAYYSRRRLWFGDVSALHDPRSAVPYIENGSASVRARDCMSADALTKVVLFATPAIAECALAACGAQAFVQSPAAATG